MFFRVEKTQGAHQEHAYSLRRKRMGGWAVAQSPIMKQSVTWERLKKRAYESMLDHYQKVAPQLNEPTRTACPEFISGYSGVRGAPYRIIW